MPPDTVISVENLGKRYFLGHQTEREQYTALRDVISRGARSILRTTREFLKGRPIIAGDSIEEFWALKNINFEVHRGEVIGVVGRNGAGKSTLLKVLSRITEPSQGRVTLRGRVASLLEVGTGFHPELTGRENIFLNGAILGMSRIEIKNKFAEIVAFAEVEKFLDTPVKRYSSGMYVRLAFAVAAHLEPEILIVDEVLAVGDAQFQKKCLGKIRDISTREGRTVLFVSHNMGVVQRLCTKLLFLQDGQILSAGDPGEVIEHYLSAGATTASEVDLSQIPSTHRRGTGNARFTYIKLTTFDNRPANEIRQGEPFRVILSFLATKEIDGLRLGFSFISGDGTEIMGSVAQDLGVPAFLKTGLHHFECQIDPMVLRPGRYYIRAAAFSPNELYDHIDELTSFDVNNLAHPTFTPPTDHAVGHAYVRYPWKTIS